MFERNKVEHSTKAPLACELVLDDGRELIGHLIATIPRGIIDELNATGGFAEFETLDRQRSFYAKSSIRLARSTQLGKIDALDQRIKGGAFDPHAILGIDRQADRETIRRAYHALAKVYHPDRLQAFDLPPEILQYTTAMAKRINAAYSALSALTASASAANAAAAKPEPAPERRQSGARQSAGHR